MKIFNIMMSRELGGIQQAYIDYSKALADNSYEVINITSKGALINDALKPTYTLSNFMSWCPISIVNLGLIIKKLSPDIIICHGNRAINFAVTASNIFGKTKIVGIAHNYKHKGLMKCDFVIAITKNLREYLLNKGINNNKIFSLPNMLAIKHKYQEIKYKKPIVIGSMGRFVKKKGFDYLIKAINLVIKSGYDIKLLLGGNGEEEHNLKKLCSDLKIDKQVHFSGWVKDKNSFFDQIDIFCLSSISEPFGIIILEAIEQSKPIVATKSGGPQEIIRHGIDGFIADTNSAEDLAKYLMLLISNQENANNMTKSAYLKLKENYDIKTVSHNLSQLIRKINDL